MSPWKVTLLTLVVTLAIIAGILAALNYTPRLFL